VDAAPVLSQESDSSDTASRDEPQSMPADRKFTAALIASWLFVGIPLSWGIWETLKKSAALLH
jgi:hypothetical protein